MSVTTWLDNRLYPSFTDNWDDWAMRRIILEYLRPQSVVLDLGAGAGILPQLNFAAMAQRVCGVDPDKVVLNNPNLDEGKVGSGEKIPYADATFDLVFANNLLEHLRNPNIVFGEIRRVLKPGGALIIKTPNCFHYVAMLARLTPLAVHKSVNRLRGRDEADTYPTVYRANSARALRRLASANGLAIEELQFIEGRPEYLRIFWPAYLIGLAYERLVNSAECLGRFRVIIIAVFRKES